MELARPSYQVFINHRGPDVKKTIASLIYHSLTSYGFSVFLDKDEIRTGDTISPAILGAINSSVIHIAIFSKRYAESSWCLNELCTILKSYNERKTMIIPVFFGVDPADLRYIERGAYTKAFEDHQRKNRVSNEVIDEWKNCLRETSFISGLIMKSGESDHGELVEHIVVTVLKELSKREALEIATYPVGLDQAAKDFENEILKQSQPNTATIVGIAGMGGIGKSTLARHLYNLRRPDFRRSCFISGVRERGLLSLQRQVARDLLGIDMHIESVYQGKVILRDRLRFLPIFIVLDDVDHMDQLTGLLDIDSLASGSLMLITSRDKGLLSRSSAQTIVYDVKTLHTGHARQLFCSHAFGRSEPYEEFEDLIEEFLKFCEGLPLSLIVLAGQFVRRPDRKYWKQQFINSFTTLPDDIIKSLKVTYESLDPKEKELFLDIGCFLVGEEMEMAIQVLEELYGKNKAVGYLESLHQKCFLNFQYDMQWKDELEGRKREAAIDYNGIYLQRCGSFKITMHRQLRELARHIAREEFLVFPMRNRLRFSCSDDIEEMLQWQVGPVGGLNLQIRGIRSSKGENQPDFETHISAEGVRLFVVESSENMRYFFSSWDMSGNLVWLRLGNVTNSFHFPLSISLQRLRVLQLQGDGDCLEELFHRFDQHPLRLTELNVDATYGTGYRGGFWNIAIPGYGPPFHGGGYYFRRLLGRIGTCKFITKIALKNVNILQSLPIDFSELRNLSHLDLSGCTNLRNLPNSISKLEQLHYLGLEDCINLSIPLGEILTLGNVNFKGCGNLVDLPEGIPYQRHLKYLNLLSTGLLQLPQNLERLERLEQLRVGSPGLTQLRFSVANVRSLRELTLINCPRLQCILPEGILAPNLVTLTIDSCPITDFSCWEDQETIRFLRDFTLKNTSISEICIPEDVYPCLETIDLSENIRLVHVKTLPSALLSLNLENCKELKTLTSLSNLVNLKLLVINRCLGLETLNVEGLILLEEIEAEECWELKNVQGLSSLERLKCLKISTDTRVIWNDICQFLTGPPRERLSTVIFTGKADDEMLCDAGEIRRIMEVFSLQTKIVDIVFPTATPCSRVKIENFHSYAAILICFITTGSHPHSLTVRFSPDSSDYRPPTERFYPDSYDHHPPTERFYPYSYDHHPPTEYITHGGEGSGRRLHVFMWRENSKLFKDYKSCSHIHVDCPGEWVERGWIVMVHKITDPFKVCEGLITCFGQTFTDLQGN